jgi:hypothetical protein
MQQRNFAPAEVRRQDHLAFPHDEPCPNCGRRQWLDENAPQTCQACGINFAQPVCRWFATCTNVAPHQVQHPTLGWVNICQDHLDWLGEKPSPTQFVPPLAAAVLDRHPETRKVMRI